MSFVKQPEPLYLTGSRYFGTARPDSDWDFFGQDTEPMREWLKAQGFIFGGGRQPDSGRPKPMPFNLYVNEDRNMQVQLVHNVRRKLIARELVRLFLQGRIDFDINSRERVWDSVEHQVNCWFWWL